MNAMSAAPVTAPVTAPAIEPSSAPLAGPRGCSNFKLRQASRLVSRHYDAVMAEHCGIKTTQYSLLSHLATMQPVRPADLAAAMGLDPSSLTRNLQPLVAQGWVLVAPGEDRRSRLLSLTADGRLKRQQAQRVWKQAQLAFNDKLGSERVARLHALLDECLALLADPGATP